MKKNVGMVDAVIRVVLAVVVGIAYFGGYVHGKKALVLAVLAVILLVTAIIGVCPLYMPFGISTRKPQQPENNLPKT